jgi:hypothetical protein
MKRMPLAVVLLLAGAIDAHADDFQVFEAGKPYYIAHGTIFRNHLPIGSTNASGRIRIDLPPGAYSADIAVGTTRRPIQFTIDNSAQLKRIEAR